MEKKVIETTTPWGSKITFTVDEELNKLKGKNLVPQKLEEANKALKRMNPLPKISK